MSSILRLFRLSRTFLSLIVFSVLFEQGFSQMAPALTVHQGLPANYDIYQKVLYGGGTYIALTLYPWEFFTSTDGLNWTRIPGPPLGYQQLSAANANQQPDYTYGAGRWVVVSDSGKIFSSTDRVNWTQVSSGTTVTLWGVNYVDSMFFATGDSTTLLSSPDGITWTRHSIPASNATTESFFHVDYGNGVLTVSSNSNDFINSYIYVSDSGVAGPWVTDTVQYVTTTKFVKGRFYRNRPAPSYSTDARNWTNLSSGGFFYDVFADSNRVYFVSDSDVYNGPFNLSIDGAIASSSDGVNFGPAELLPTYIQGGSYAAGHYFVYYRDALESTDAVNWSMLGSYGPTAVFNGSTYVKVSPTQLSGYISSSPDFVHWTPADTVTTGLNAALYDSTQFLAFGPTIYSSPNGTSWSMFGSPALDYAAEDFHCIYGGGTYVAWWVETPTNYVWYSHDGINWGGSALPPPSQTDLSNGYNSAVTEITNIQFVNGKFWLLNSAGGGTPAAVFVSSNGENFDTVGFNNTWSNFNVNSFDQFLYVPDSSKYYIFGTGAPGNAGPIFFTSSTTNPLDSTIVLQNHTGLTGNLSDAFLYNGQGVSYGVNNFVNPGGFDFAYSHGHFVGGAIGPGNAYNPNIPPVSYVLWSSDGTTWDGSLLNGYAKVLSNIVGIDTFRMEGWNNFEMIVAYADKGSVPDSLLNFSAVAVDNSSAHLTWQVAVDSGSSAFREFVIEHRTPDKRWRILDSVAAVTGTASYQYTDPSPVPGYNDYRLILRGPDTASSYSPVRRIYISEPEHIAVFPNPARSFVVLTADPAITAVVTLLTEDGRQLQQLHWNGTKLTISLAGLPTGTYHVAIREPDGTVYNRQIFHVE
jgi:hypothetical protein